MKNTHTRHESLKHTQARQTSPCTCVRCWLLRPRAGQRVRNRDRKNTFVFSSKTVINEFRYLTPAVFTAAFIWTHNISHLMDVCTYPNPRTQTHTIYTLRQHLYVVFVQATQEAKVTLVQVSGAAAAGGMKG